MTVPDPVKRGSSELTRRRLLVEAGATGAAAVWLGTLGRASPLVGVAGAAEVELHGLRRSSYMQLSSPQFDALVDGQVHQLELVEVGDLAVADSVAALRDRDDAFRLLFRGSARDSFAQGTRDFSNPQLGSFPLFVVPVEQAGSTQDYEVVVDRTVRIPGLEDDGAPRPQDPGDRGSVPGRSAPALSGSRMVLRSARLRRSTSNGRLIAEIALGNAASVETVQATLSRRGRRVGTAAAAAQRGAALLRFGTKAPRADARYELAITAVDRNGHITAMRKHLRLS